MIDIFFNISNILFFLATVFIAGFIQGITGFGFGIILMCFIPNLLGYKMSVGVSTVLSLIISLGIIIGLKGRLDLKRISITTMFFIVFQSVGISLLFSFSNEILKISLGITLIFFAILFISTEYGKYKLKSNKVNSAIVGGMSGLAGGMLGIGGPPVVFYYHSIFEDKNDYNKNMQVTFVIVNIILLVLHIRRGNITIETLEYSSLALIVLFISTWIGLKVFKRISKSLLTKITIVFLLIAGIMKLVL
ncbi:sulfite exporter TauE/SafE family protein [Clostridium saccharoperbutylacetonicum]